MHLNLLWAKLYIPKSGFLIFPEKEIEKTVTYENSHLQAGAAYGDQSSYGGVDTSQHYYPVYISCFSVSEMFL